jgi:ssDNA-binding Zn-finger/Zn-ribbon topoisomerase 1
MAMVYEHIAIFCETELPNEKQMLIDICNECAKDMMLGNIAVGKSVGEQLYKKKYS